MHKTNIRLANQKTSTGVTKWILPYLAHISAHAINYTKPTLAKISCEFNKKLSPSRRLPIIYSDCEFATLKHANTVTVYQRQKECLEPVRILLPTTPVQPVLPEWTRPI